MTVFFEPKKPAHLPEGISVEPLGESWQGRLIRNDNRKENRVILYCPGGGFIVSTPGAHQALLTRLCVAGNSDGLLVIYRLAPENPYPAGFDDCLAGYHYLLQQGYRPENITIAGDSAGGNLVLSLLMYLRDKELPLPARGVMLSPLLDLTFSGASRIANARRDPMLPSGGTEKFQEIYHPNHPATDPYITPVFGSYRDLPPILCQVGDTEILLDDSVTAANRAQAEGARFYLEIWQGMPHVWQTLHFAPESRAAIERVGAFIDGRYGDLASIPGVTCR